MVGSSSTNVNLSVSILREAKRKLDAQDVDPSIPRYIAVGPSQIESLLSETAVTSADFNTVKALVQGEVDTFMGFKFIMTNRLSIDSNDIRSCFAWAEDGMSIGAVRMEENKVVKIFCDETPD